MRRQSEATRKALRAAAERLDEQIKQGRINKERRAKAGEMGIELAKYIVEHDGTVMQTTMQRAQAIIDTLEGKDANGRQAD